MAELTDIPTQPEYVAWRKEILDSINTATGRKTWNAGQLNKAVGNQPNGRTWAQINEELRLSLANDAPKATPGDAYTVGSVRLSGQWRGFDESDDGTISDQNYRGMSITRIAVGQGPESGNVEIVLGDEGEKVDQDFFRTVTLDGIEIATADAVYDQENQTWSWVDTGISFGNGTQEPVTFRHDPPPTDTVLNFIAEDVGNGFTGYKANGRELKFQGVVIGQFITNDVLQGIFVMDINLAMVPLPQDLFNSIVMNGYELFSKDATYDSDSQTWSWTDTGFDFVVGQEYSVIIKV